ncbi:MAG: hypothetical protein COB50_01100 [Thiotrichales bacterium]|nr:MAG: hypothetical protein COB50_01100 [Thiotrichales bacterium]
MNSNISVYGYVASLQRSVSDEDIKSLISNYASTNNLTIGEIVEELNPCRIHWQQSRIHSVLSEIAEGSEVIVYEAADVARSTAQILEALKLATSRKVIIHFVKYDQVFTSEPKVEIKQCLSLVQNIESDFVAKRTTEALARRKQAGLPLGRPKGVRNKSLKLDPFLDEIKKYIALGLSKSSIAKLIRCHPQTLYNYIDKRDLATKDLPIN